MFVMEYHPESGRITYASAGHPPPLLRRNDSGLCERLDAEGLILGVRREFPYEQEATDPAAG